MAIYLDNASTTMVRQEAIEVSIKAMSEQYYNPSSTHIGGQNVLKMVQESRKTLAIALGCKESEIIFTSCGTESNNLAIHSALFHNKRVGKHIISSTIEHSAVLEPLKELEKQGYELTLLEPDREGNISLDSIISALREDTALISLMLVNNELGTVNPIADIGAYLKKNRLKTLLHTDAVQGFLKRHFTTDLLNVDFLSISGHKFHAPKGIGALYARTSLKIAPQLLGGGQENGRRSGTEAVSQIVAMAKSAELGYATLKEDLAHLKELKTYAIEKLSTLEDVVFLQTEGADHILPISLPYYKSEVVVRFLSDEGIYISSGSACHRGKVSRIFSALKLPPYISSGILRISFSKFTRKSDIDALVLALDNATKKLIKVGKK